MAAPQGPTPRAQRLAALQACAPLLRCPLCYQPLDLGPQAGRCPNFHSFDLARDGYLNLLPGHVVPQNADTAPMVAARQAFLGAGHFLPLGNALGNLALELLPPAPSSPLALDLGAGPGWYLARLLERLPGWRGLAVDLSKHAALQAARCHPALASVVADSTERVPLADGCVSLLLLVFAPRNPEEFHRLLAPDGLLLVVTPTPRHLQELLGPLGLMGLDPQKDSRLAQRLGTHFTLVQEQALEFPLTLSQEDLQNLVGMGPNAFHQTPEEIQQRVAPIAQPCVVTASFKLGAWRPAREGGPP